ncbi:MAG: hypothetical protein RLZZ450_3893 [Pseudomonadota bacterium]
MPVVVRDLGASALALEQIARDEHALAATRVAHDGSTLELWQAEVKGMPALPATLQRIPVDAEDGWSVSALAALEALRARLLGRPPDEPAARVVPAAQQTASMATSDRTPWLWLRVAMGAAYSPGGLGFHPQLLTALRLQAPAPFSADAFAALDLTSTGHREPEGAARVRATLLGLAVDIAAPERRRVTAALGAGAALALLRVGGSAPEAGYSARTDRIVGAGPALRASAAARLSKWSRVRLELLAAITAPHAVVRFAGREVASWGRPFVLLTLGVELGVPRSGEDE